MGDTGFEGGALLGAGLLAIWNGMASGHDTEFLRWHVTEHIPERLSVPGFLRARRYRAIDAAPAYFNFYEVAAPAVLSSPAYLERLNAPSDWTRLVVPHFTDTARILCRVAESRGAGVAGSIVVMRFDGSVEGAQSLVEPLAQAPDVSAVHLLARHEAPAATRESAMRAAPDGSANGILMVEGVSPERLAAAVAAHAGDAAVTAATGAPPMARGLYQLDFLMSRSFADNS